MRGEVEQRRRNSNSSSSRKKKEEKKDKQRKTLNNDKNLEYFKRNKGKSRKWKKKEGKEEKPLKGKIKFIFMKQKWGKRFGLCRDFDGWAVSDRDGQSCVSFVIPPLLLLSLPEKLLFLFLFVSILKTFPLYDYFCCCPSRYDRFNRGKQMKMNPLMSSFFGSKGYWDL